MSKGQRGNKEGKKPKQERAPVPPVASGSLQPIAVATVLPHKLKKR
jgi:hypothetical protein